MSPRQVGPWGPLAFRRRRPAVAARSRCASPKPAAASNRTGGPYLPARAAFGRFVGFEVGWMMWFSRVTSHASVVNGLTLALAFYWPALAAGMPRAATITALTLVLTWINVRGIKQSSWVVNALTIGKLLPLALFIIGGIWFIDPSHFANMPAVSREQFVGGGDPADLRVWRLRGDRRARPARPPTRAATCRSHSSRC